MRQIVLYIATSMDGYIATKDDGLDWLINHDNPTGTDYGYEEFYNTVDTIVMGKSTYRVIREMGDEWIYANCKTYVVSRTDEETNPEHNITFIDANLEERMHKLRQQEGKDIWLMGGGQLVSKFIDLNLLDRMTITIIPTLLGGGGIPLFPQQKENTLWSLANTQTYENGVLILEYERKKEK